MENTLQNTYSLFSVILLNNAVDSLLLLEGKPKLMS